VEPDYVSILYFEIIDLLYVPISALFMLSRASGVRLQHSFNCLHLPAPCVFYAKSRTSSRLLGIYTKGVDYVVRICAENSFNVQMIDKANSLRGDFLSASESIKESSDKNKSREGGTNDILKLE